MNSSKSKLNALDSQLVSYHKDLERLDNARKEKEAKNQLDDTASNRIKKFIDNTAMRIDTIIEKNMVLVNGNEISRSDWNNLNTAIISTQATSQTISRRIVFG
jgi:hypothetical protein